MRRMCKSVFLTRNKTIAEKIKKGLCLNVDDTVILPVGARFDRPFSLGTHPIIFVVFFVFPYGNSLLSLNKKKVGME